MQYDVTVHRIVRQKKSAGDYVEVHTHAYFHYIYTMSGVGVVEVGGHSLSATAGVLFLIPPGVGHAVYGVSEFIAIDIKFYCGGGLAGQLQNTGHCVRDLSGYEQSIILDIMEEAVLDHPYREDVINARWLELLLRLLRRRREGQLLYLEDTGGEGVFAPPLNVRAEQIDRALRYIDANLRRSISVAELAGLCGYTENYFSIYFKNYIGCTVTRYINSRKVERAKELMLEGRMNITQISDHLGFESIHYFSRLFKKLTGMSPTMYSNRANSNLVINVVRADDSPDDYAYPLRRQAADAPEQDNANHS